MPGESFDAILNSIEAGCHAPDCLNTLQEQETCNGTRFEALPHLTLNMGGKQVRAFEAPRKSYTAPA